VCSNAPTQKTLFRILLSNAPQIAPSARVGSSVTVESGRVGSYDQAVRRSYARFIRAYAYCKDRHVPRCMFVSTNQNC